MPLYPFQDKWPEIGERVFLAPSAEVAGEVAIGDDVSFWFHTAARGDVHWIRIGARTSIQDGAVLHVTHETWPLSIGEDVVVAHGVILHSCTVEDGALVGIGARLLDGAVVGSRAQIGAGAVVTPGQRIPAGHLALGVPAKAVRPLTDEELDAAAAIPARYLAVKDRYRAALGDGSERRGEVS